MGAKVEWECLSLDSLLLQEGVAADALREQLQRYSQRKNPWEMLEAMPKYNPSKLTAMHETVCYHGLEKEVFDAVTQIEAQEQIISSPGEVFPGGYRWSSLAKVIGGESCRGPASTKWVREFAKRVRKPLFTRKHQEVLDALAGNEAIEYVNDLL